MSFADADFAVNGTSDRVIVLFVGTIFWVPETIPYFFCKSFCALSCDRFDRARQKIAEEYDHVEQELIEEFRLAHQQTDKRKLKRIAAVLQNFKVSMRQVYG